MQEQSGDVKQRVAQFYKLLADYGMAGPTRRAPNRTEKEEK